MTDFDRYQFLDTYGQRPVFDATNSHPIFVFGTLRPGCGNDRRWHNMAYPVHDGEAYINDHRLVSNGGFPYCIPAEGQRSVGTLVVPHPDQYDRVLDSMDSLEGWPIHYNRKTAVIDTPDGPTTAWYYIPDDWQRKAMLEGVPGNDWNQHVPRRMNLRGAW